MRSQRAKVLHELGGRPLLQHPLAALRPLGAERVVVVVGNQAEAVRAAAEATGTPGLTTVLQAEQRGTGHAVRCAAEVLGDFTGDVVILYGDVPLIRTASLEALVRAHRDQDAALSLLTVCFPVPTGYGRILRDSDGRVTGIVEERDATPAERAITEINPGIYCVRSDVLLPLLGALRADNAQGELYLTDVVGLAAQGGGRVVGVRVERAEEVSGINTRAELAEVEGRLRAEIVARFMEAGVTFEDPATAYVGPEVQIGADTVIGPNVTLRGKTVVGSGCRFEGTTYLIDCHVGDGVTIRFGCHGEGAQIGGDAIVGPFARLRPGTRLGERVHIGNFVETKNAQLAAGVKANHLTYLGDCEIGEATNVGAGTITCNYDGFRKSRTIIGARVQIGSDTQLVAPVTVGDDAYVAAGTTVTRDVAPGALAVSRVPVRAIPGWVARKRAQASNGAAAPARAQAPSGKGRTPAPTKASAPKGKTAARAKAGARRGRSKRRR